MDRIGKKKSSSRHGGTTKEGESRNDFEQLKMEWF
jgi:hypothetical protein